MNFDIAKAARSLSASAGAIRSLVVTLDSTEARWRPAPDQWSILEVVNHLRDEEVEDFRARLDILIHRPTEAFAPIDPQGWVASRNYCEREIGPSLERFLAERERSLEWMRGLSAPNLEHSREHPAAGKLTGQQMLASWVAHDLLHVRQIARRRYQYLGSQIEPLTLAYAGTW